LLIKNGGVWMDASMIVLDGSFLDEYWKEMNQKKADLLVYELSKYHVRQAPYLENWFLMAPKNSRFAIDIYNEFLYAYDYGWYRYKRKILEPSIFIESTLHGAGIYLMQHAIIMYLLRYRRYNYIIKDANESMYKICNLYNWNRDKLIDHILHKDLTGMYAIKINGYQRKGIKNADEMIEKLNNI
jgi:hypothetical protein